MDSIQCLTIAVENPAEKGEYRVFNQLDEVYSIVNLAEKVVKVAKKLGIDAQIKNLQNPRTQKEQHYYKVDHEHLKNLGFKPTRTLEETVELMLRDLSKHKDRILEKSEAILPSTTWYRGAAKEVMIPSSPGKNYPR